MVQKRILVCDDEPGIRKTLAEILEDEGYAVFTCETGEELISFLQKGEQRVDAILQDIWLPGMSGVEVLEKAREMHPKLPIIMISGHATMDHAVKAIKLGAFDFLEKPLNLDRILVTLNNALRQSNLERKEQSLIEQIKKPVLVGKSEAMKRLQDDILLAAPSPGRVMIRGESGSGKEVTARLLHQHSDRANEPFIELNCAAIPEELIESELFGHVKGSFTGAIEHRTGKFELADGGTLFLDEIGDMSLNTQAKVLRVLQEQRFEKIGSAKTVQVNVRVITATNKNLEEEIKKGSFREDLFFRLSVIPIHIPALRHRLEDLPQLCEFFSNEFSRAYGKENLVFGPETLALMSAYRWPGNVRELRNAIERLMIMNRQRNVQPEDLPPEITGVAEHVNVIRPFNSLREAREDFEKRYLKFMLEKNHYHITHTAEALQIERSNLHRKIKQLEIGIPGKNE